MRDLQQKGWWERFGRRLPDYLTLVLIVVCGSLLARLTWLIFPADPALLAQVHTEQTMPIGEGVQLIRAKAPRVNSAEELAGYHLFGQVPLSPAKETPAPTQAAKTANVTHIPMELAGVYALPGKNALAILKIQGQQEVFAVGEPITLFPNTAHTQNTGAVLKSVDENCVKIEWSDGAKPQSLCLDEKNKNHTATASNTQPLGMDAQPLEMPQVQQPYPVDSGLSQGQVVAMQGMVVPMMPSKQGPDDNVDLGGFRAQVLADNRRLYDMVRATPFMDDGQLKGFRVNPGSDAQLFQASGLFAGDIVTEVNGVPLNNMASGLQAIQNVSNASNIQLKVIRSGQEIIINRSF